MKTEVQPKDRSQVMNGNGNKNAGEPQEEVFSITSETTNEELQEILTNRPEVRDEYLEIGHDAFVEKYSKEKDGEDSEDGKNAKPKENEEDPKPEESALPPELRRTEEELNEIRDTVVPGLKSEISQAQKDNEALRSEIEAMKQEKKKPAEKKKEKLPEINIPEITIPELSGVDMFTEEGQKQVLDGFSSMKKQFSDTVGALKQLKEQNSVLHERLEDLRTVAGETRETVEETRTQFDKNKMAADVQKRIAEEIKSIDELRQSESGKAVFGDFSRDTRTIENDYIKFAKTLAETAKIDGPAERSDGSGRWVEPLERAIAQYHDPKSAIGEELRKSCPVKPPEDMEVLDIIYDLREFRNSIFERDSQGKVVPISYERALRSYSAEHPEIAQRITIAKEKANRDKVGKAIEKRNSYAQEAPVKSEQATAMEPEAEAAEVKRILEKTNPERTKEEREYARKYLSTLPQPWTKTELDALIPLEDDKNDS